MRTVNTLLCIGAIWLGTQVEVRASTTPESAEDLYDKACSAMRSKEWNRAVDLMSQAIKLDDKNGAYYTCRGEAYARLGRMDKALQDFDKAVELRPDSTAYRWSRALILLRAEELQRALADLDSVIEDEKTHNRAILERGHLLLKLGKLVSAMKDFDRLIELNPRDAEGYHGRAIVYNIEGTYDKATENFLQAIRFGKDDPYHLSSFAWFLAVCPSDDFRQGKLAVVLARMACELTDWKVYSLIEPLAAGYAEAGQFADAVKWQKRAIELAKQAPEEVRKKLDGRLKLYENRQPYRVPKQWDRDHITARSLSLRA